MAGIPPELRRHRRSVIAARYEEEGSVPIARDLGVTRGAVLNMAKRMGLVFKDKDKKIGLKIRANNTSCDRDYFKTWSPNMAYCLGYIYADGYIDNRMFTLRLRCHSKDEEILLAVHRELKSKHKIGRLEARSDQGRNNGPQTYCVIANTDLVRYLVEEHGVKPNKSKLDLPLPYVPDDHFGHFLRGYFDGDGHIHKRKQCRGGAFSFVGTEKFIEGMRETICNLYGARKVKVQKQSEIYAVVWSYHQDLIRIYNGMYPSGDYIFLKRKRDVFDEVVNQEVEEKGPTVRIKY